MDECAQLFAHGNGTRRQHLREENGNKVVDRTHPEEGACRPAPAVVAHLRRNLCLGRIEDDRAQETEPDAVKLGFGPNFGCHRGKISR